MNIYIPTPLRSYTGHMALVEADGDNLAQVLISLDGRFPGLRFRIIDEQDQIRDHIKLFVNREQVETLDVKLERSDEVHIICALSGG